MEDADGRGRPGASGERKSTRASGRTLLFVDGWPFFMQNPLTRGAARKEGAGEKIANLIERTIPYYTCMYDTFQG